MFFQLWCEACSFSKIFSRKTTCVCFFGAYNHLSPFFQIQKDAQSNLATNGPYESPRTPIFDHLVQFWIMSVPKQPPLKLRPALFIQLCYTCEKNTKKEKNNKIYTFGRQLPGFNLSGGCFGTDIIQNCTKLSNIGVNRLISGPIFAKFHCVSFLL